MTTRTVRRRAGYVASVVAAIAILAWLWKDVVEPRVFPKRFGVVIDNALFRSGRIHPALLPNVLTRYGIDDVITLTFPKAAHDEPFDRALASVPGVRLQRFSLEGDGTGDPTRVVDALVAIHDALARGDQVLVQCAAGSERTGGVVYLYRTLVLGQPGDDAYAELLRYGHRPSRNPRLEAFLNAHMAYFAGALRERGISVPAAMLPRLPEPKPGASS